MSDFSEIINAPKKFYTEKELSIENGKKQKYNEQLSRHKLCRELF
jgi:hypothetical protein